MTYIIWFISFISLFALSALFHEIGHFVFSKFVGIKVYEFSIGLPFTPRILKVFQYKETEFNIKIIPIGGFISYAPMDKKEQESVYEFLKYPSWRKLVASIGGPLFSFLFSFILLMFIMIQGIYVPSMYVEKIIPGSPAEIAKFQKNDFIIAVNNNKINDFQDIKKIISENSSNVLNNKDKKAIKILFKRQGELIESEITPAFNSEMGEILIGIVPLYVYKSHSITEAYYKSVDYIKIILKGFFALVRSVFKRHGSLKDFSGPVGIAMITKQAVDKGNKTYWLLLAFFSLNLGLINLLPIPALDGGQIVAYSIEIITGKPFKIKIHQIFGVLGLIILLLVLISIMYSDISIFWLKK
ncbi:site-2 protease family protein [Candidatus Poribacteria bacterium]|nr:site-2 protease family protein [Candidatus Poribacteria bacterium]